MKESRTAIPTSSVVFLKILAEKMKALASPDYAGLCHPFAHDLTNYVLNEARSGEGDVLSHALDRLEEAEEDYAAMSNGIGNAQHMLFEMKPKTEEGREMKEKLLDALSGVLKKEPANEPTSPKFKVGDLVRCIDVTNVPYMEFLKDYRVTKVSESGDEVWVFGGPHSLHAWRFNLVADYKFQPGDFVTCVTPMSFPNDDDVEGEVLEIGEQYEVLSATLINVVVMSENGTRFPAVSVDVFDKDPMSDFDRIEGVRPDIRIPFFLLKEVTNVEVIADESTEILLSHTSKGGNLTVARKADDADSVDFWVNPGR